MPDDTSDESDFFAYEIYPPHDMPLTPAPKTRPWMDDTQQRFAYRCLPLTIANQSGWIIANPSSFSARWNGGPALDDVTIVCDETPGDKRISSLFGHGAVTFNMPYLFRTPPEMNLWVKGPSNWPKDGAWPLEGIVETDWTAATFTMNWKLTRPGQLVRFERGEPICMVVPYPRNLLSELSPKRMPLAKNEELCREYENWSKERSGFQARVAEGDQEAKKRGWQKDYFQGRDPGKERFEEHQTKLAVAPFEMIADSSSGDG